MYLLVMIVGTMTAGALLAAISVNGQRNEPVAIPVKVKRRDR